MLIAVECRGDNGADSSLAINPGPSFVIESNTQGFFFAESADDVKRSVRLLAISFISDCHVARGGGNTAPGNDGPRAAGLFPAVLFDPSFSNPAFSVQTFPTWPALPLTPQTSYLKTRTALSRADLVQGG